MAVTLTPSQVLDKIRTATYGRDVREAIAQGIEFCEDTVIGAVRYDESQGLETTDKARARTNIDAAGLNQAVRYDAPQTGLSAAEKLQARTNIGADEAREIATTTETRSYLGIT